MDKNAATRGSKIPQKASVEYFQQETQDLQDHISNFDELIKEIEIKLHRKSEQTLAEESNTYKVNIADLENGFSTWTNKCKEAELFLKERLQDRCTIAKKIEKTIEEIESLKQDCGQKKCTDTHKKKSEKNLAKQTPTFTGTQVSKSNICDSTSTKPEKKSSCTKIEPTPGSESARFKTDLQEITNGNVNSTVKVKSGGDTPSEEKQNRTKVSCNISVPFDMKSEEPINISLLEYKKKDTTCTENESSESQNVSVHGDSSNITNDEQTEFIPGKSHCKELSDIQRKDEMLNSYTTSKDNSNENQTNSLIKYPHVCDAATQTETKQPIYDDTNERPHYGNRLSYFPVGKNFEMHESNSLAPANSSERQQVSVFRNIYQTMASNAAMHTKNLCIENKGRLVDLLNKWKYDCTNPEEYFFTAQLRNIPQKKQLSKAILKKSQIRSVAKCGVEYADQDKYSHILAQKVQYLQKKTPVSLSTDHPDELGNNELPFSFAEGISNFSKDKVPFSFGDNKGCNMTSNKKYGVVSGHLNHTRNKTCLSSEINCYGLKSKTSNLTQQTGDDTNQSISENSKVSSEFHRQCTTPITVRIIKRLEKENYKRLSPITRKKVVRRYPVSPKYRKPRTYVSAFRRKMKSMAYNI